MQYVCGSSLHTRDADGIEAFKIQISISLLNHVQLAILDLNILCVEFGVETDIWVVRILLEVIYHPIIE